MGKEGTMFYKRLANMLSRKQERPYSVVMGWMRCRLSFAIIRSAIMCIRGTRSTFGRPIYEGDLTLAAAEGRTPSDEHAITVYNLFLPIYFCLFLTLLCLKNLHHYVYAVKIVDGKTTL